VARNEVAVQKIASYALGNMIGVYDTCQVNDLRGQVDGSLDGHAAGSLDCYPEPPAVVS